MLHETNPSEMKQGLYLSELALHLLLLLYEPAKPVPHLWLGGHVIRIMAIMRGSIGLNGITQASLGGLESSRGDIRSIHEPACSSSR